MEGIQFDEETGENSAPYMTQRIAIVPGSAAGLTEWMVKKGYAKNAVRAEQLLLGVAALLILIAITTPFLLLHKKEGPSAAQLQVYINRMGTEKH